MHFVKLLSALALGSVLALPVAAVAESVTKAPKFGNYQAKGFLTEYARIPKSKVEDSAYKYRDTSVDFSKYNRLLVDRIKVWFAEDSDYKGIDPDELKVLTDYFYQAIEKAVGDAYPMVKEAGPDVLRLRIAATDLIPNKPEASVTTLVVPFLWVGEAGTGVAKGDTGSTMFTGQASIEMEALDSVSNRQLAAFIQTETGKKYDWTHGVSKGVSGYINAYSKWAYTKQSMDDWAHMLRDRLDEVHGKPAARHGE